MSVAGDAPRRRRELRRVRHLVHCEAAEFDHFRRTVCVPPLALQQDAESGIDDGIDMVEVNCEHRHGISARPNQCSRMHLERRSVFIRNDA